jgi:hypothetical protein
MNDLDNLPPEAVNALREFLKMKSPRPGRMRLMAEKFGKYGPTITSLASCVHPLIFETDIEGTEYGIAGSCFLAKYKDRLFVITAKHCLTPANGNDVRIALNPKTKTFLPLKQLHRAESNPADQDYADVAIFEAAPENLEHVEQQNLNFIDFNSLFQPKMDIQAGAKLIVIVLPENWTGGLDGE